MPVSYTHLDELPPGRKEIKTYLIHGRKYNDMIVFIKNEIFLGRQAYIVCPLIEDNEGTVSYTHLAQWS